MNAEQELREIRNRWDVDDFVRSDRAQSDILTLLEAIDQRDAIIHDLQLDGAALARRAVDEFIQEMIGHIKRNWPQWELTLVRYLTGKLSIAHTPDPLPPDQARAEAERLRAKLRLIQAKVAEYQDRLANHGGGWPGVEAVLNLLLELAKENT